MDPDAKTVKRNFWVRFGPLVVVGPCLLILIAVASTCFLPTREMVENDVRRLETELKACIARKCSMTEALGLARSRGFRPVLTFRVVDQGNGRRKVWTADSAEYPNFGPVRGVLIIDLYPDGQDRLEKVVVIETGTAL